MKKAEELKLYAPEPKRPELDAALSMSVAEGQGVGRYIKAFRSGTAPVVWTSSSACVGIIPISASAASQSSTYSPASMAISVVWCSMQILAGCGCMVWGTPKRMQ